MLSRLKSRIRFRLWRWLVINRPTGRAARLCRELDRARAELALQRKRDGDQRRRIATLEGEVSYVMNLHRNRMGTMR